MGAVANAVSLMEDATWAKWLTAASVYTARQVLVSEPPDTADHAVRRALALDVVSTPNLLTDRLVRLISADPEVATKGATAAAIGEQTCLDKVAQIWTPLAKLAYPTL